MTVCQDECVFVSYTTGSQKNISDHWAGVTDDCEPPCECCKLNMGPLQEQLVTLPPEPCVPAPLCLWSYGHEQVEFKYFGEVQMKMNVAFCIVSFVRQPTWMFNLSWLCGSNLVLLTLTCNSQSEVGSLLGVYTLRVSGQLALGALCFFF